LGRSGSCPEWLPPSADGAEPAFGRRDHRPTQGYSAAAICTSIWASKITQIADRHAEQRQGFFGGTDAFGIRAVAAPSSPHSPISAMAASLIEPSVILVALGEFLVDGLAEHRLVD
jgi:hypothetical protein